MIVVAIKVLLDLVLISIIRYKGDKFPNTNMVVY